MARPDDDSDDDAWLSARLELLAREKQLTRLRDEVNALRRALPRRPVHSTYTFESAAGSMTLEDLFGDRSQLLVYHFMFGSDWESGCKSCSFWADHFAPMIPHLRNRDTAFAVVSSAPVRKFRLYAERMGWKFPWVSAAGNDFNTDFAVTFTKDQVDGEAKLYNFGTDTPGAQELPGASAFIREDGKVFHTYSTYARGLDTLNGTYHWLDLTARGRDEAALPSPMAWVKRHDEYPR